MICNCTICRAAFGKYIFPPRQPGVLDGGFLREGCLQRSEGYRWTLVKGEITSENGHCTGLTPGRLCATSN